MCFVKGNTFRVASDAQLLRFDIGEYLKVSFLTVAVIFISIFCFYIPKLLVEFIIIFLFKNVFFNHCGMFLSEIKFTYFAYLHSKRRLYRRLFSEMFRYISYSWRSVHIHRIILD